MTATPVKSGYAPVNGLRMYYEIHGAGEPLVLLHGGFGMTGMFGELLPALARDRQVIAVDLQAHGRTADIDRPLRLELMGDDVAALIRHLGFGQADVIGYSMGGGAALRTAIQHPELVRKLVVVSIPFKRSGWYAEMVVGMEQMGAGAAEFMRNTPMYQGYAAIAPDPEHFPVLCAKMGDMMREDYDWSKEVAALPMPVLLVFGDADGLPPAHAAEFFALLGGGQRDGSWDGSGMSRSRLAILPATTHYDIPDSPALAPIVAAFLDASAAAGQLQHTAPKVDERAEQPTVGIRTQVTMAEMGSGVIPRLHSEVFGWLAQHGVPPAGAPFIRYHVIDMTGSMDIELGVPVASAPAGDGRVIAGALPAGRYASLVYTGIMHGVAANAALLEWGAAQGLVWDRYDSPNGDGFGARYESFLTDPADEPDMAKWETEVAIRLADG